MKALFLAEKGELEKALTLDQDAEIDDNLCDDPRFKEILEKQKKQHEKKLRMSEGL